jgi:hypothetical protein
MGRVFGQEVLAKSCNTAGVKLANVKVPDIVKFPADSVYDALVIVVK